MRFLSLNIIWLVKAVAWFLKTMHLGAGATWPGELALQLDHRFLSGFDFAGKTVIFVLGTNGKTTTTKMIQIILTTAGRSVVVNSSGANLDNGIASALVIDTNLTGKLKSDTFVFEIDEASLPRVSEHIKPNIIVLLNLFRDQLDRYGEVDAIAQLWIKTLKTNGKKLTVVANADDPELVALTKKLKTNLAYFGLRQPKYYLSAMQHATDSIYCPRCGQRLKYQGVYFSHLGDWECMGCKLKSPVNVLTSNYYQSPLPGVYNLYNTLAAALVGEKLGLGREKITAGLAKFTPAFGRGESFSLNGGKTVRILLSKNPTGFNESLRTVLSSGARELLLVLNDRIPDGRDVSWIWDVDFELLRGGTQKVLVSGDRTYDLALRLKYAEVACAPVPELSRALAQSFESLGSNETLWILPTYSAMLEVRKILVGRKIL